MHSYGEISRIYKKRQDTEQYIYTFCLENTCVRVCVYKTNQKITHTERRSRKLTKTAMELQGRSNRDKSKTLCRLTFEKL